MTNKSLTAIGLMSGTSMDGIDAAIIKTDGTSIQEIGSSYSYQYSNDTRARLRDVIDSGYGTQEIEQELTELHADAVKKLLQEAKLTPQDIDVIGFHGQTIKHDPENGITVQIGDGDLLAKLTGIDVVNDFRTEDVKNGGQGAPLVPLFHQAITENEEKPIAIVNIGGISNVTWIGEGEDNIIAFDTGPGNALIDDWIQKNNEGSYDKDGQIAFTGDINEFALAALMSNTYFQSPPPKSLDRNAFDINLLDPLSVEDGAATLSAFTAGTIIMSDIHFPQDAKKWYITGGGRLNKFLIDSLEKLITVPVLTIDELGYDGDMLEAQAFGFLAVRSLYDMPLTLPTTTGAKESSKGGVLHKAA